eukprot:gnl/Chilomastix_caulleri/5928.p1 GENE.gnl/Chilomastix_caulleri/5928~~gnl/Chilomastix_caulleri/5928.p1  ORF type:complete len:70 (+),score=2.55 gnl/Chilomastix_caulleri/5928:186-395(+)
MAMFYGFSSIFILSTSSYFSTIVKKTPIIGRENEFLGKYSPPSFFDENSPKTLIFWDACELQPLDVWCS